MIKNDNRTYENLRFTDNFMFCKIMQYNEDICKELVELIIGKKIGGIVRRNTEQPIEMTPDRHGIRMDVYLEDDNNTVYNIEMQTKAFPDISRRSRYYQSMIDADLLERGHSYGELDNSYVIFIMMQDPFKKGLPIYSFRNTCREVDGLELGDGAEKIFIYSQGVRDILNVEMKALLDYLKGEVASSELTKKIDEKVAAARHNTRWKEEFMTLGELYAMERSEGRAEGREEGEALAMVSHVEKISSNMKLSVEEACKILEISVDEYSDAKKLIEAE